MSEKRELADRIVGRLLPLGAVHARAMFGGYGIFHEDLMFGLIAFDRPYFKVDAESKPRFQEAGCVPFVYTSKNKPTEMSYWTAPEASLNNTEALLPWAGLGLAAARRARAKKPPKKMRRSQL